MGFPRHIEDFAALAQAAPELNLELPFSDKIVYAVNGLAPWWQIAPKNRQAAASIAGSAKAVGRFGGGTQFDGAANSGIQYGSASQALFSGTTVAILAIINEAASGSIQAWLGGEYGYDGVSHTSAMLVANSHQGTTTSGALMLAGFDSSYQYRISAASGVCDGKWHCVAIARTGASTAVGSMDGRPLSLTFGAETSSIVSSSTLRTVFGGIPPLGSANFSARRPLGLVIGWNGVALTQDFLNEVTRNPALLLQPDLTWVPVSSGSTYTASLTEASSPSDAITSALTLASDLTESVTAADAFASALTLVSDLNEALSPSEAIDVANTVVATLTEAATTADAFTSVVTLVSALAETMTASEALTAALTAVALLTETPSLTETLTNDTSYVVDQTETVSLSESVTSALTLVSLLTEAVTAADSAVGTLTSVAALTELASALDALVASYSIVYSKDLTESVTLTELISLATLLHVISARLYLVPDEDRTYIVPDENRTYLFED